jgi:hypothetical protein
VARITERIEDNPTTFDSSKLALPPSIADNNFLRRKLVMRMEMRAEQLRAEGERQTVGLEA